MKTTTHSAILLFAHGSSDPAWAEPFEKILARVRSQTTQPVALAYLERMPPSMDAAVASLAAAGMKEITLVPLFLAVGGHMRNDLPGMVKDAENAHGVTIQVRQTIGESPDMIANIAGWAVTQADVLKQ
jgi:sirohydrochlorin cobaltochelatase